MQGVLWKLPVLRGLSPMRRGLLESVSVVTFASLLFAIPFYAYDITVDGDVHSDLAQIGATLLIAYAVETSWVLQFLRKRGPKRENWVGLSAGVSSCGLGGIGLALALSGSSDWPDLTETLASTWSIASIAMMGLFVALQPWAMYEWVHASQAEYSDE